MFKTASVLAILTGMLAATSAYAQTSSMPDAAPSSSTVDEVVVTGSRVIKNGYQAPTPVSVLSGEALQAIAPTNIADAVNRLPALMGSVTPRTSTTSVSSGALGVNQLNLRSLGSGRTLVLLDGKRVINSSADTAFSAPDVNTVPNALISRVEIVTGGASAAYGSDALAGVVNFVVDHDFTGFKGSLQSGVTTYGDDKNYLGALAFGKAFADGRGHLLLSGELSGNDGIGNNDRPWNDRSAVVAVNPARTATNGLPFYILARDVGVNNGTPGGVITAGPLRGVVFGQGGAPSVFDFGVVTSNNVMIGGDWRASRIDDGVGLDPKSNRASTYGRLSYDVLDNVQLYAEGQWARTHATSIATPNRRLGNLTIRSDNPFIPASVAARMAVLNLASFTLGTTNGDIGRVVVDNERTLSRWAAGASGKADIFGTDWSWNTYYQRSQNVLRSQAKNVGVTANYLLAVDAVRDPATGAIICRSTLTNPTNGCVAFNPMGTGVNSSKAIAYVTGVARRRDVLTQDLVAFDVHGEPFSTWAGPVAIAAGVEHRKESLKGSATALDEANAFFTGNYHASKGSYDVTEGFLEAEMPLAKEVSWAKSLDLNAAVRATDYSTSGYVTTWKIGAVYAPIADIRFRASHSRDIRAPSLGELFSAGQTVSGQAITDPFTNTNLTNSFALRAGNPNLKPEKADSNGVGVVLAPSFIPGLQASADFYSIKIDGAIAATGIQQVVNLCFQGETAFCSYITRVGGVITTVQTLPQNVNAQSTKGLDLDVSYSLPLSNLRSGWGGSLKFRGMATYVLSLKTTGNGTTLDGAGVLGSWTSLSTTALASPKFRSTVSGVYSNDGVDVTITWRHVDDGVYNSAFVECASSCPAGTNTISDNHIGSSDLIDLGLAYRPLQGNDRFEVFGAVDNVFNKSPPLIYGVTGDGYYQGQSNFQYDRIGRSFRAGVRFKM